MKDLKKRGMWHRVGLEITAVGMFSVLPFCSFPNHEDAEDAEDAKGQEMADALWKFLV